MKTLYFEGAGAEWAESATVSGVGNCRIRSAFHLDNGATVYVEIIGSMVTKYTAPRAQGFTVAGWVTDCFSIRGNIDDADYSLVDRSANTCFEYSKDNILAFINSLGCSFDAVEVLPDLAGYRVFADSKDNQHSPDRYNYGDVFAPDQELIKRRTAIRDYIAARDKAEGIKPCFSIWVDEEDPAILHYHNFRRNNERFDICVSAPKDPESLPTLHKENAIPGAYYNFCNEATKLEKIYQVSKEYAKENHLAYRDRCVFGGIDCGLI